MSDFLYTYGSGLLFAGTITWSTRIRVSLLSTLHYATADTDQYLTAIPTAAILATGTLVNPAVVGDAYTADPTPLTGAATRQLGDAIVIYEWTGSPFSSRLLSYHDSVLGLPCSPDGVTPLEIIWPHGPEKIFNQAGQFGVWEGLKQALAPPPTLGPCEGRLGAYRII